MEDLVPEVLTIVLILALGGLAYVLFRWPSRRALLRRLRDLSRLAEAGRVIGTAQLDLHRLAQLVYEQAGQIVDTTFFQLGLFEGDRYRLLIWIVDGQPQPLTEFQLTPDSLGIIGWLRENNTSLIVRDFEREAGSLPAQPRYVATNPPRSAVFVPLHAGQHTLGAVAIQSRRPNAFSEEDLRLLTIIANQAAAALENARLYEQTRRRANHLELLAGVAQRINVLQPLPALYRQVVDLVKQTFPNYTVAFYEARDSRLHQVVSTAPAPEAAPEPEAGEAANPDPPGQAAPAAAGRLPRVAAFGEGLIGEAALRREPVLLCQPPSGGGAGELAVPVVIDDRVLGVLDVHSPTSDVAAEGVKELFSSLAAQIALAILEAEVYAAEQTRTAHLAALAQVSRALTANLELDDLLDDVLAVVDERFGYKAARIFLVHEDQLVFHAGTGSGAVGHEIEGLRYDLNGPGLIALAGRTRQPLLVDNVHEHPDYVPGPGLAGTRSEMVAPMVMGNRLIGVFDVQSDRPGAFTEQDARTLQTLADGLAVAVRNARLFEFERRRRRLAEIMREVSVALTSTLQLDNVLELILDGLALVVQYDVASILLLNDAGEMVLRATRGATGAEDAIGLPLAIKTFSAGEEVPPVLPFGEVDLENEYHELLALPEPHACIGAALAPGGEHLGYLVVDLAGQTRFAQSEIELIATFASQAAVAIENARLYTAQREQAWISTALLQVAEATVRAADLDEVLATVARLTPMLVGVDRCAILLPPEFSANGAEDATSEPEAMPMVASHWRLVAYAGSGDALTVEELAERFPEGVPVADWQGFQEMVAAQQPVVLDPQDDMPQGLRDVFVGVVILLPLLAKGRVEGAMVVGQVPGETPFTAHRIRLMTGIANQAAQAIESAILTIAQQEEAWVSTALLQVAEAVAGQTLERALETVARLTPILVGIDRLAIYQWDPAAGVFRPRQVTGLERQAEADVAAMPLTPADLALDEQPAPERAEVPWQVPLPPALAAAFDSPVGQVWPLRAGEDLLGLLVVEGGPMLGRRLAIVNGIAYQLAMAMENARLAREVALQERLERELEVGRDIQASFLPQSLPRPPGWDVEAVWRAARQVGGDFYDFIPLRPGEYGERWGIVIADVADKGVPAALFMALSRTLVRTVAISRIAPAATLARVNELIMSDARSDQFVTVFYAVWEPATGRVRYATGGHNPPLWITPDGQVTPLPGRGMALGVLENVAYDEREVTLAPGEALLLYTDGLTDAVNLNLEEFTLRRVREVVAANAQRPAAELLGALRQAVEAHVGGMEAFDDLTVVVLKRAG